MLVDFHGKVGSTFSIFWSIQQLSMLGSFISKKARVRPGKGDMINSNLGRNWLLN
jgi:hypothetical protein